MEKQISSIRRKMIFTIGLLVALSVWQHEFIVKGVMAHVQINVTILGTGAFGVLSAFLFVSRLANEVTAFRALKEMSDDIRRTESKTREDIGRVYSRCLKRASVFRRPKLLGHAYDLVTEELARTRKVRISVETMNTLVHKIESSINDEKSLVVYISGLLVFMGLIGTFIGLLHMVSAIGGIIGSLAKSGDAGTGAFSELLGALEEPLKGMASGFASSLFGLFCSLLVGLMGRFAGQAAGVLKANFEAWLAGVVQLSDAEIAEEHVFGGSEQALHDAPVADAAMVKLVGGLLGDYSRVASTFADAAKSLKDMRTGQAENNEALARLADGLAEIGGAQARTLELIKGQAAIGPAIAELSSKLQLWTERMRAQREQEAAQTARTLEALTRLHNEDLRVLARGQTETSTNIVTAVTELATKLDRLVAGSSPQALETAITRSLEQAHRETSEERAAAVMALTQALDRGFGEWRVEDETRFERLIATLRAAPVATESGSGAGLEAALDAGLARIAQSVEAALGAYASLARVALATLERTHPQAAVSRSESGPERQAGNVA